jgi:hypothetical protein
MKKIIFVITLLGFFNSVYNQSPLNLSNITLSNSTFGYFSPIGIRFAPSGPVNLTVGSGNYDARSTHYVELLPGFVATAPIGATKHFMAEIANQQLDATILEPETLSAVPKYSKVEIGINIPSLDARINAFLDDNTGQYKPGTTGYTTAFNNGTIINPYDPAQISVDAIIFKPSSTNHSPLIRYGFYYDQYERTGTPTTNWAQSTLGTDEDEWRIRFSPEEIGSYHGFIQVWINGIQLPENFFFSFTVVNGTNPGFVQVASNDQYLQFQNGEQFFPVGSNYAWSWNAFSCQNDESTCATINCTGLYDYRILPRQHKLGETFIDRLTDTEPGGIGGGGNHSRLIFSPWSFDIEWERLGNYHTRQVEMFELDEYLKYCEQKDVYLSICPFFGGILETGESWECDSPKICSKWQYNPYNINREISDPNYVHKGIAGLDDKIEYFTNTTARQLAKNKLRYVLSRWGYSTHYVINELYTEIGGFDQGTAYFANQSYDDDAVEFLHDLADYAKNNIKSPQLITGSYLNYENHPFAIETTSTIQSQFWDSPNIDLASGHEYFDRLDNLGIRADDMNNALNIIDRPCYFNENDQSHFTPLLSCTNKGFHNQLWSSTFSGAFGSGLGWDWKMYLIDEWFNSPQGDIGNEFKAVRDFVENIDLLSASGYEPHHLTGFYLFDNFYIVKPGGNSNKAYGWFHNRSYNEYTNPGDCGWIDSDESECYNAPYQDIEELVTNYNYYYIDAITLDTIYNYPYLDAYFNPDFTGNYHTFFDPYEEDPEAITFIHLSGLDGGTSVQYLIEFYYTSGPLAGTFEDDFDYTFYPDGSGNATVFGPPTGTPTGLGWDYPGDWAYCVHKINEGRSALANAPNMINNSHVASNREPLENDSIESSQRDLLGSGIFPNPNDGSFIIYFNSDFDGKVDISMFDQRGTLVFNTGYHIMSGNNIINFTKPELSSGVYYLVVPGLKNTFKVVIK